MVCLHGHARVGKDTVADHMSIPCAQRRRDGVGPPTDRASAWSSAKTPQWALERPRTHLPTPEPLTCPSEASAGAPRRAQARSAWTMESATTFGQQLPAVADDPGLKERAGCKLGAATQIWTGLGHSGGCELTPASATFATSRKQVGPRAATEPAATYLAASERNCSTTGRLRASAPLKFTEVADRLRALNVHTLAFTCTSQQGGFTNMQVRRPYGAACRIRTDDRPLTRRVLYQLS